MSITSNDIRQAIKNLDLAGQPLCVHSSLSSFGRIEGGASALLDGLLAEQCTVLVPSFVYDAFAIRPPEDPSMRPARNGWDYTRLNTYPSQVRGDIYTPATNEIERSMGVLPATIVARPERIRGNHPLNSFAAIGPRAHELIAGQQPLQVYAPLEALAQANGTIILMGVGLERMTFLHYAEQQAGRTLFRRWANDAQGKPMLVAVGSCSEGFGQFASLFAPFRREIQVGQSLWQVFPAREVLAVAVNAIRARPDITHCDDVTCERCNDAVQGGPLLTE